MIPSRLEFLANPALPPVQLAELFSSAGEELYLVGGSVRDAILGRELEDFDFATSARPGVIKRLLEPWADTIYTLGEKFGTISAIKQGQRVEITTFRDEVYTEDSRKPAVTFSDNITSDLSRRDFTVNAIALSLPDLVAVDPFNGLADIAGERLRTPAAPEISFGDDPLRMLRLFRFQASLGFTPDESALAAVGEMAERLTVISAERVRDELSKLMVTEAPGRALESVVTSGLAAFFLPELPTLAMEQDPHHRHKDVLAHTFAVVDKTQPDLVLRLAALLHDVGKPDTRAFGPGGVSFHHHEVVGARMARARLRALRYPREIVNDVGQLVFLHLRPHTLKMGWTDSAVRRYVRDAGPLLDRLNELVRCDVTTANKKREQTIHNRIDVLEERIAELSAQEEIAKLRAPIDGNDVMTYLNIDPGPLVGEIMSLLLEKRIDDGPYSEVEAMAIVRDWAVEQGIPDPGPFDDGG